MSKLIKSNKNIFYSFVQGRLSNEVGSKYQHFPIHNWKNELMVGKKLGFDSVEWIVSDFSNPIFNKDFLKLIKDNLKFYKIKISSISLDLIMNNPLYELKKDDAIWLINRLNYASKYLGLKRISVPIEERSRYNNFIEKKKALSILNLFCKKISKNIKLCIETDITPNSINKVLNKRGFRRLGLLLDIGNIRANGHEIEKYFQKFSSRIYSIHIKFREHNYGKSKLLPRKNFYELNYLIKNINYLKNLKDISFQTFKSKKNFLNNIKNCIKTYNLYAQQ